MDTPPGEKNKIQNATNQEKITTYVYKKMASTQFSHSDTFLSKSTFLTHILYTHLQSMCPRHIKNKYIYTEKTKNPKMNK